MTKREDISWIVSLLVSLLLFGIPEVAGAVPPTIQAAPSGTAPGSTAPVDTAPSYPTWGYTATTKTAPIDTAPSSTLPSSTLPSSTGPLPTAATPQYYAAPQPTSTFELPVYPVETPASSPSYVSTAVEPDISLTPEERNQLASWVYVTFEAPAERGLYCVIYAPEDSLCSAIQDDGPAEANPFLTDEATVERLLQALPVVEFAVENFPTRRARLNMNVIPQLFAILQRPNARTNDQIRISVTRILRFMGRDLTPANRATARTRLTALYDGTTNAALRTAIEEARTAIGAD